MACSVLVILITLMLSLVSKSSDVWRSASNKVEAFQSARGGFENLTRQLSQAVLNTYWDYQDPNDPTKYIRKSELHFKAAPQLLGTPSHAVFFQAPANRTGQVSGYGGLGGLLNACGFFIDYTSDSIPSSLTAKLSGISRFRLMQWTQNTEDLKVYDPAAADSDAWFSTARNEATPIAENVIALILWPKLSHSDTPPAGWTDSYSYDSRAGSSFPQPIKQHQLPPTIQVTMVAIDGGSAARLGSQLKAKIDGALAGLFAGNPSTSYTNDLTTLESRLRTEHIDYRIFTTSVALKESKWSEG